MRTTHTIEAEYPLAGSEGGLPIKIMFTFEQHPRLQPSIGFQGWTLAALETSLPGVIYTAIGNWAQEWLDDDEGYSRAWDVALDDIERQRESARDMGMRA